MSKSLINTRGSRYYRTDDDGHRTIVHPGQAFEGDATDAKQAGIVAADTREGKAYLAARGEGAEPRALTPDEAALESREAAEDRDDDAVIDPVLEAAHGTDLVARSMATARIRDPYADPDALLEQAVDLAEADVGDGPVGVGDIDPETGENRDNIGEPGAEPPTRAADGRPIVELEDVAAGTQDEHVLSPDEAVAQTEERLADGEQPPVDHAGAAGGTITAAGHPEALRGGAPPAPADDAGDGDGDGAATVEFTSDAAKDKAKSLKVAQSSLEAGKGSGSGGAYTVRDVENVAKERREAKAAESG